MGKSLGLLNNMKNKNVETLNDDTNIEDGFSEKPVNIGGKTVAQFTFGENANNESAISANKINLNITEPVNNNTTPTQKTPKGLTPPINGENFDIKRSYQFRESTIRMLNELKTSHPDINVYLNTIVDAAIRHYHDYIIVQGNKQK